MKLSTGVGGKEMVTWKHLAKVGILGCRTISYWLDLSEAT